MNTGDHPTSTARLAAQAASLSFSDLSPAVRTVAKQCLLDAVGVGLAGAGTEAARIAAGVALEDAPSGPCSVIGSTSTTSASGAALANGTAIHALDYDDMSVPLCGHPTAPLLPALLALGELAGASGAQLLSAFVAGYEAECRVGASVDPDHYARGFHATATVGTIGAAVGSAHLLGLDAAQMETAIGIGVTQAAGLKSMFGTMCKPLHAGRAAASGILAARLARDGFTSASDALACAQGFAAAEAGALDTEALEASFGSPWHVLDNLFKFHAACYFTHGAIEAMLDLAREGVHPAEVGQIELVVPRQHLSVCNIEGPVTGLEGKFSLRFATAVALASGIADESCFTDGRVAEAPLQELQRRIEVRPDDSLGLYDTVVLVEQGSGTRRIAKNTARPAWRIDPSEQSAALLTKFHSLVDPLLGSGRTDELAEMLLGLEAVRDVRELRGLLAPSLVVA
jgi:2-methylcitrate dehydratase PrpD